MNKKAQKFSASSTNFLVNVLNFLLATLAIAGVTLPADPSAITNDLQNTLSASGWVAVVGMVIVNVVNPIYHAFVKGRFSLTGIFSSSNFWIQLGTLLVSLLVLLGIEILPGTVEDVVGAIYAKDWVGLAVVLFTNVLNPLIRYLKDRFALQTQTA